MRKLTYFLIASPENNYRPPVLSYKAFLIYGIILLLLRLLLGVLPSHGSAVDSNILMNLINQERSNRKLPSLFIHPSLLLASSQKSQDMIDRDYFSHIDPDGNYVWGRIEKAGYSPYKILGENLAIDFSTSEGMVKAWLDSPTHRANLLHNEFLDQGLTALYGDYQGRYTNLTTSLFGTLAVRPKPLVETMTETQPENKTTEPQPESTISAIKTPQTTTTETEVVAKKTTTTVTTGPMISIMEEPPTRQLAKSFNSAFNLSRIIFTLFGILLLIILGFDSVIIYRHEAEIARSHSSYHLFGFILIVLVSILIWWW